MKRLVIGVILLFALLQMQAAHAQSGITWNTEFFSNPYLIGPAVLTRQDTSIGFNWGASAPATGVPADNFSARFATNATFAAGTYRFYVQADDAFSLHIDFRNYLSTVNQPRPGETLSVDVTLSAGVHHIQVDYIEYSANALLNVRWENAANPTGPNFPGSATATPAPVGGSGGSWTGEYFNNATLSGTPTATINETTPSHNWGTGAPLSGIGADNFSVRWSSTQNLNGSTYQITVRADDGVRVYVNNTLYIDEWHGATNETYRATFTLPAGNYPFRVEYYEFNAGAFLEYSLAQLSGVVQPTFVAVDTPRLSINTARLNVRNAPGTNGAIITRVTRGETFTVVGRSADAGWLQISINGGTGWVSSQFVVASNVQNVPVVTVNNQPAPQQPAPVTAWSLVTTANLNLRQGPGTNYARLGRIPNNTTAPIIARTADNTWWKISYNGTTAWVYFAYIELIGSINLNDIPVMSS